MASWDGQLRDVVRMASAAASDQARWNDVLAGLCRRFGATSAALHTPRPDAPDRCLFVETGLPPGSVATYAQHWVDQDPWFAGAAANGVALESGICVIGSELCDWHDLDRTAFYNDFAAPQGVHGLMALIVDDGTKPAQAPLTLISLYREPRLDEFSRDDQRAFESVYAALRLALHGHWSLGNARQGERIAVDALAAVPKPLLVLAADGRVLHANPVGGALLEGRGWVGTLGGRVVRLGQLNVDAISGPLARALAGVAQALPLWQPKLPQESGVRCATARLVPLAEDNACRLAWPRAAVLLLIDEPEIGQRAHRLAALARRYGLSPAETRLFSQLADGLNPKEIANTGGVSIHTVRTHLHHLFDKTGARRQGDLVRLLGDSGPSV